MTFLWLHCTTKSNVLEWYLVYIGLCTFRAYEKPWLIGQYHKSKLSHWKQNKSLHKRSSFAFISLKNFSVNQKRSYALWISLFHFGLLYSVIKNINKKKFFFVVYKIYRVYNFIEKTHFVFSFYLRLNNSFLFNNTYMILIDICLSTANIFMFLFYSRKRFKLEKKILFNYKSENYRTGFV